MDIGEGAFKLAKIGEVVNARQLGQYQNKGTEFAIDTIARWMSVFSDAEFDLVIKLLEKYSVISMQQLYPLTAELISILDSTYCFSGKPLVVTACKTRNKSASTSADLFLYVFKEVVREKGEICGVNFSDISFPVSINKIRKKERFRDNNFLIVDDYCGSGWTFLNTALEISAKIGIPPDEIKGAFLCAQKIAIYRLKELTLQCTAARIYDRGITDDPALVGRIGEYDLLESKLRIGTEFMRGFGQAEALISMLRTPNNTLPIFWLNHSHGGSCNAPFPR